MQGLILDTSSNLSFLLRVKDGRPVAIRFLDGGKELSRRLGLEVQSLIEDARPDFVAVGTGPGSYTGTRVGVAMAKALAFGWRAPLLGFCGLEAFAPPQDGPFAILLDARLGGVYCLQGLRTQNTLTFEPPKRLAPTQLDLLTPPLYSPAPEELFAKKGLIAQEVTPDFNSLSHNICQRAPTPQPPLEIAVLE